MTTEQPSNLDLSSQQSGSEIQAIGAVAGMIGPILFTVGFVVQGFFRRGEYDPIAETVSALEAGPNGWVQQLNFLVFASLIMIFGAGLGSGLRTGRRSIGSAVVVFWGVGLLGAGLFPLREDFAGQTYDSTGVRQPIGAVFFLSTWVGLAVLYWCLRPEPRWRVLARYTLLTVGRWRSCFSLWPPSQSRLQLRCIRGQVSSNVWCWRCGFRASLRWRLAYSRCAGPHRHAGCRASGVGRLDSRFVEIGKDVGNRFVRGLATAVEPVANLGSLPAQHLVQGSG
jgi:Protein of unknown function (DUF998)